MLPAALNCGIMAPKQCLGGLGDTLLVPSDTVSLGQAVGVTVWGRRCDTLSRHTQKRQLSCSKQDLMCVASPTAGRGLWWLMKVFPGGERQMQQGRSETQVGSKEVA